MNLKTLLLAALFLFIISCGPSVYFGEHYTEGPSQIRANNYSTYYYHLYVGTEPACFWDEDESCFYRDIAPVDYVSVSQQIEGYSPSGRRLASDEISILHQLSRTADLTFLFHPSESGTYRILVNTRVYVRDEGFDNVENASRELLFDVLSERTQARLVADEVFDSALDLDTGVSSSSFERIPSSSSLNFSDIKLFTDQDAADARFEQSGDYFALFYRGETYSTPFLTDNAYGYVAVSDPDSDGVSDVYFYYQPLDGFGEVTDDNIYARLRFEDL